MFGYYIKLARNKGFSVEILNAENGQFSLEIMGNKVLDAFKHESGKHVVQRCPPSDRKGRKQTSIVVVGILPIYQLPNFRLNPNDIELTYTNKSTNGGQAANKSYNAVRAKHKPTSIVVLIQTGRSAEQNRKNAISILTNKVYDSQKGNYDKSYDSFRSSQMKDAGRSGDKVRTYNFKEGVIYDHINNKEIRDIKNFFKGKI